MNFRRVVFSAAFLMAIFMSVSVTCAQDISQSTLHWKALEVTDGRTAATKATTSEFISNSAKSVQWIQRKGNLKTTFNVISVEGSWADIKEVGRITYVVELNGHSCSMRFERSSSELLIVMDFDQGGDASKRLKFKIESVD